MTRVAVIPRSCLRSGKVRRPILLLLNELATVELPFGLFRLVRAGRFGLSRASHAPWRESCAPIGEFVTRLVMLEVFDGGRTNEGGYGGGLLRWMSGGVVVETVLGFLVRGGETVRALRLWRRREEWRGERLK